MDSPEGGRMGGGIVLDFPVGDNTAPLAATPLTLPKRLRERLATECKTPSTVEEIEAKLRDADIRREQFYKKVSSKARPKSRSPSQSSSHEEELRQRLQAKLQAAEQKRLSILAKAQKRLARLDELRQEAKSGVDMRFERESQKLGTKVESLVQQAVANRMLIVKAHWQRRATLKERSSQSLLRRVAREYRYKERVCAAIHQKRTAAEKKRMVLLEAKKKRARARVLQVQQVAISISHQREIERRWLRDQLEDRLQRAKYQRAEYLRKRGRQRNYVRVNWNRLHKQQADILSRKLARCWRHFLKTRRTTLYLAKAYDALNINENHVKSLPFEKLALLMESTDTLQTLKSLLERLENRFKLAKASTSTNHRSGLDGSDDIDHLLRRVATPKKRTISRSSMRGRDVKKVSSVREGIKGPAKLSRYPVRIVLCAYMILGHPDSVFSGRGEREIALSKSAKEFVLEFELLLKIILEGPIQSSDEESDTTISQKRWTFRSQLATFDRAWSSYLNCFVVWKVRDAQSLEEDLVRAACQLELSMIQKCKLTPEGDNDSLTYDLKAIRKQVAEDQKLIRDKVKHLSGDAGIERMECSLSETRSKYFEAKENGSPVGSPILSVLSPGSPSSSSPARTSYDSYSDRQSNVIEGTEKTSRVVRSLFREDNSSSSENFGSFSSRSSYLDSQLYTENEVIVNEFLHDHHAVLDGVNNSHEDQNSIKLKIRETMEKAFWDAIIESMKQDKPNYDQVVQLMREVRDEICDMAPQRWKQDIVEAIDLEVFSQILKSGNLDIHCLGKILEFAMATLQKLSSPASDDEMKATQQNLLEELSEICQDNDESKFSHVTAMIKGLRFVLEQIQALKREISKARIRMMVPLLKGPAGLDYLRGAFANRYGSPDDACTSLPMTVQWLSSMWTCKDQEWIEHSNLLYPLLRPKSSYKGFLPSTVLRTGGNSLAKTNQSQMDGNAAGHQLPECNGERVDLLVRLGLLKLVSGIDGLKQEVLPETLKFNFARLRAAQAQIQTNIVISTSILVCRQMLMSDQVVANTTDMESTLLKCTEQVLELIDHVEDVSIEEIVETMSGFLKISEKVVDTEKLRTRKLVMTRTLAKSLQAGDPVFQKVSHAVYLAARGVALGGNGPEGKKLAEIALQQVEAVALTGTVVEVAEVLGVMGTISIGVHGPWYRNLIESL
ncbi:uncharacterized protein LOC119984742 isoform X1 [Tripterygium wilfordii]|uniref:uncharacterized protein LOC119984742 isoform X1 n=1 Tax=Tripterygium wilfordii TaxID=458696 RepID=UPI0018F8179A|nr:uncharacterized protein LOC119984742 isoform X1 [Tripterygium wilfordii]